MQAYGKTFARVYNLRWTRFAAQTAPALRAFYAAADLGRAGQPVLDVCCGTGQLALHFLDAGYAVTGVDLSGDMLALARENTAPYVLAGRAHFIQADAANFSINAPVGLALSTFDALNHLPSLAALRGAFDCVYRALLPGGWWIFDLNTRRGLMTWGNLSVEDTPEATIIIRGVADPDANRALTNISGYLLGEGGRYDRFEERVYETMFDLADVQNELRAAGFGQTWFARLSALETPLDDPEAEGRVFVVCQKEA